MKKFFSWLNQYLEEVLCAILLVMMTIVISMEIFLRLTGLPLTWTEEVGRYLFVWLIYIACALGVKKRKHLRVDAVGLLFKERGNFVLDMISNIAFMIFCAVISYYGVSVLYSIGVEQHQVSPAIGIPMVIPYASFVVGCMLMLFRLIQDTILIIKAHEEALKNV